MAFLPVLALGVAAGTIGRPRLEQFAAPGILVAKSAAMRAIDTVRQTVSQLSAQVGRADKPRSADSPGSPPRVRTATAPARLPISKAPAKVAPAAPFPTAVLTISSTPRGARVQIDGVARGVTPVTIARLRAGLHQVRLSHAGYRPVTRTVTLKPGKKVVLGVSLPVEASSNLAGSSHTTPTMHAQAAALLEVGRPAPHFVAKDRVGILYRTADYRGRKLLVVFVQHLDRNAQRIIRELNALQADGAPGAAVVVVLHPDRASIRRFIQTEQIHVPVLFGTQTMARAYGVSSEPAVLYLVTEDGRVALRQVGRINPGSVLN